MRLPKTSEDELTYGPLECDESPVWQRHATVLAQHLVRNLETKGVVDALTSARRSAELVARDAGNDDPATLRMWSDAAFAWMQSRICAIDAARGMNDGITSVFGTPLPRPLSPSDRDSFEKLALRVMSTMPPEYRGAGGLWVSSIATNVACKSDVRDIPSALGHFESTATYNATPATLRLRTRCWSISLAWELAKEALAGATWAMPAALAVLHTTAKVAPWVEGATVPPNEAWKAGFTSDEVWRYEALAARMGVRPEDILSGKAAPTVEQMEGAGFRFAVTAATPGYVNNAVGIACGPIGLAGSACDHVSTSGANGQSADTDRDKVRQLLDALTKDRAATKAHETDARRLAASLSMVPMKVPPACVGESTYAEVVVAKQRMKNLDDITVRENDTWTLSINPKDDPMPTEPTMKEKLAPALKTLEADAGEAAWRLAGSQFVKLARDPIVALLSRHLAPDDASLRVRIAAFLETELGTALLSSLLSVALSAVPARNDVADRLARELRVRAMAGVGDVVAEVLMGPLRQVAVMYLQGAPVTVETPPAALPDGHRIESVVPEAATVEAT